MSTNLEMGKTVYETACSVLDGMGIKYRRIDESLAITFGHRGDDMEHNLLLIVNAERDVIQLMERLPFAINPDRANDVAAAVCITNERILSGKFSYNMEEKLNFDVTQIYSGSLIGEETIKRMLIALVVTVEQYDDKFMALNKGYLKPEDFKND